MKKDIINITEKEARGMYDMKASNKILTAESKKTHLIFLLIPSKIQKIYESFCLIEMLEEIYQNDFKANN